MDPTAAMKIDLDIPEIRQLCRSLPGLVQVQGKDWESALSTAKVLRAAAETPLTFYSTDVDTVNIILRGSMKVRAHSEDGRAFSLYRVSAGEICMLSLAFVYTQQRLLAEVHAESDLLILQIARPEFELLLVRCADFRDFAMAALSGYVIKLLTLVEQARFGKLQTRVLDTLQSLGRSTGSAAIAITHQALADELGSSREVISRLLKTLEHEGAVRLGRGTITLSPSDPKPSGARAKGRTSPGSRP